MNTQPALDFSAPGWSHAHDPATSREAAHRHRLRHGSHRALLLEAYRDHDRAEGHTADEIGLTLGWSDYMRARRRVTELHQDGLLEPTGSRGRSQSDEGLRLRITSAGRRALEETL